MDGLINLYKPLGVTSTQALYEARKITGQRKSGHAGTLDPLAEGVLILCLGRGTKLVEKLMDQPKVYRTVCRLDVTSTSFDFETERVPVPVAEPPTRARLDEVLQGFVGEISQVPPLTSAVKVRGRPAYRFARQGEHVALDARQVRIYGIEVCRYAWPELEVEVTCGRGTYIRALVRDLAVALGTGGCLAGLTRSAVGPFTADDAWSLGELAAAEDPVAALVPVAEALQLLDRARGA